MASFDCTRHYEPVGVGELFAGRYEIVAELGSGGMGTVYKARDHLANDVVALKVMQPELASDRRMLEMFKQEMLTARRLTHRNVLRIYDIGECNRVLFISMEFIDGYTLADLVTEKFRLNIDEFTPLFVQFCDALAYVHGQKLVHRDIKPANVMMERGGTLKLMDFGIARKLDTELTERLVGTPRYMAPELFRGEVADRSTDIFAAGAMFYELLTGGRVDILPRWAGCDVPIEWRRMVDKCLAVESANRFRRIEDVASAAGSGKRAKDETETLAVRRHRVAITMASFIVAGAAIVTGYSFKAHVGNSLPNDGPHLSMQAPEQQYPPSIYTDTGVMQYVPKGAFTMGSDTGRHSEQFGYFNEAPAHTVTLDDFYIDKYEVTNEQYSKFCGQEGHPMCPHFQGDLAGYFAYRDYPVINISWNDAKAYAEWAGKRLPTEAEWEKAARGADARRYPWGDEGNRSVVPSPSQVATPVGSHPVDSSPYGVMDMAGNVAEWVNNDYELYALNPAKLPDQEKGLKVVRGAFFNVLPPEQVQITNRASVPAAIPDGKVSRVGFRCAASVNDKVVQTSITKETKH